MPISYLLNLSEFQIRFLAWVADGCPNNDTKTWLFAGMQFVRVAKKMEALGYTDHNQYNQVTPWTLTVKGSALMEFLKMEISLK